MTCTCLRVSEKVSYKTNVFGSHSLSGTVSNAPLRETSEMRHANVRP